MKGPWLLCGLDLSRICVIATGSGPRQGGPQGRTGGTDALPTAVDYDHCFIACDIKVPCTWSLGLRQPSSGRDRLLLFFPLILDVLNHFGHSGTEKQEGGADASLPQDRELSKPEPQHRLQALTRAERIWGQSQC